MSVFLPKYRDAKTGGWVEQDVWWYKFRFNGRLIRESAKTSRKTLALKAEENRRLELERGFNGIEDRRGERIRTVHELADEFLEGYKLRSPKSETFASYALGHVKRLAGQMMVVEASDRTAIDYQNARLGEGASPKSINEEAGFLLRVLGDHGDFIRAKLRRTKMLKLKRTRGVARAFSATVSRAE